MKNMHRDETPDTNDDDCRLRERSPEGHGFRPLPHRGPAVTNELIDQLRDDELIDWLRQDASSPTSLPPSAQS
jgi:hypothetical protein